MASTQTNKTTCFICTIPVCEVCLVCETDGCKAQKKHVTTSHQAYQYGFLSVRTQKLRGYLETAILTPASVPQPFFSVQKPGDIPDETRWPKDVLDKPLKMFARPCPKTPWHGFVESRPVSTPDEARVVFSEAQQHDPEAEMILCPLIDADWNVVLTPSAVSIGQGNDGATAGKNTQTLPLIGCALTGEVAAPTVLKKAGIGDADDPYYEFVTAGPKIYLTQLRAGAKAPKTPDFIPRAMRVAQVIPATGDLIEFRDKMKALEGTRGVVVDHFGGSLTSHYGVHCLVNGIPIVTTFSPRVGQRLEKVSDELPPYDFDELTLGILAGSVMPCGSTEMIRKRLHVMLVTLHNAPVMTGRYSFHIGFAATTMIIAGMAAALGEARHRNDLKHVPRSSVHLTSMKDYFRARVETGQAQYSFLHDYWSSSYGGLAWARCTLSIIRLEEALRQHLEKPSDETVKEIISRLNIAINQAHNGGWWMDKFIGKASFDAAQRQDVMMIADAVKVLPEIAEFITKERGRLQSDVVKTWRGLGDIQIVPRPHTHNEKRTDFYVVRGDVIKTKNEWAYQDEIARIAAEKSNAKKKGPEASEGSQSTEPGANLAEKLGNIIADHAAQHYYQGMPTYYKVPQQNSWPFTPLPLTNKPDIVGTTGKPDDTATIEKKLPKNSYISSVKKAHARWEDTGFHVQYSDGLKYNSIRAVARSEDQGKIHKLVGNVPKSVFEDSYSSDAGGYIPCIVKDYGYYVLEPMIGEIENNIVIQLDIKAHSAKVLLKTPEPVETSDEADEVWNEQAEEADLWEEGSED